MLEGQIEVLRRLKCFTLFHLDHFSIANHSFSHLCSRAGTCGMLMVKDRVFTLHLYVKQCLYPLEYQCMHCLHLQYLTAMFLSLSLSLSLYLSGKNPYNYRWCDSIQFNTELLQGIYYWSQCWILCTNLWRMEWILPKYCFVFQNHRHHPLCYSYPRNCCFSHSFLLQLQNHVCA